MMNKVVLTLYSNYFSAEGEMFTDMGNLDLVLVVFYEGSIAEDVADLTNNYESEYIHDNHSELN